MSNIQNSESGDLNQPQSLREIRIEQRRNYTDACINKGANQDGIAEGTNRIYNRLFGKKPTGKRDDWSDVQQKEVAIAENFAAHHVQELPTPPEGTPQPVANHQVVEKSGEAAKAARDYIDDHQENGNWWTNLFHS